MLAAMDKELESLENRVTGLIARTKELGTQNQRLSEALAQALEQNADLMFRLEETKSRVVALMERLPIAEEEDA
jgi:predicted nuclease with TOPRIM domain